MRCIPVRTLRRGNAAGAAYPQGDNHHTVRLRPGRPAISWIRERAPEGLRDAARARVHRLPRISRRRLIEFGIEIVAIYALWPWLWAVYSSVGSLQSLNLVWFAVMAILELLSLACMWVLLGICLRSTRWFLIATTQIVGYAVGLVAPGGNPSGTAAQIYLLANRGVDGARATTGVMAAGLINLATLFALPVLALPSIVSGVSVEHDLAVATWLGFGVFALLTSVFLFLLVTDRPIESIGRGIQAVRNFLVRQSPPLTGLPERLSEQRVEIRGALSEHWGRAGMASAANWLLDYAVLLAALQVVGAHINPAVVLIVYTATVWLAIVPLTPGGIGFVEAGLLGMLVLAGVPAAQAGLATLSYRLVSYVAPVAVGLPTYWWYRRRIPESHVDTTGSSPVDELSANHADL